MNRKQLVNRLLNWFGANARKFPWRYPGITPYEMLLCEMMTKRTRAENVTEVYKQFLLAYPSPQAVVSAGIDEIREVIRPLGLYNERAKELTEIMSVIVNKHNGIVPETAEELMKLPGIGRYVANAVLCFGYKQRVPIVDVNVVRIFDRFFGASKEKDYDYWKTATQLLNAVPDGWVKTFNQSLLDLAALVCKANNPICDLCPISTDCYFMSTNSKNVSTESRTEATKRRTRAKPHKS